MRVVVFIGKRAEVKWIHANIKPFSRSKTSIEDAFMDEQASLRVTWMVSC
jgi:hypothetical protein